MHSIVTRGYLRSVGAVVMAGYLIAGPHALIKTFSSTITLRTDNVATVAIMRSNEAFIGIASNVGSIHIHSNEVASVRIASDERVV